MTPRFDFRCGACRGIGRHRRWCRNIVGSKASLLGRTSQELERLGDSVGSNEPSVAHQLYRLSAQTGDLADAAAAEWRQLNEVAEE